MFINLAIFNLKDQLAKAVNEAKLPPGIVQLVLKELIEEVKLLNEQAIELEKIEENRLLAEQDIKKEGEEVG